MGLIKTPVASAENTARKQRGRPFQPGIKKGRPKGSGLAACAEGVLSPGEAAQVMELISTHIRTLEVVEIEARVSALEKEWKLFILQYLDLRAPLHHRPGLGEVIAR